MVDATNTALTAQQIEAAQALFDGQQIKGIAERLGVDRRTISRWRNLPAFQDALGELAAAEIGAAKAILAKYAAAAARTLVQSLVASGRGAVAARVRAAIAILDRVLGAPASGPNTLVNVMQNAVQDLPAGYMEFLDWQAQRTEGGR